MKGVVYILTNQAMPGLVKIGFSDRAIEDRMKELDSTGVPLPFECFAAWVVENGLGAEKALHVAFGDHRLRERREFFRISPDKPTAILRQFGQQDVTPKDDVVGDQDPSDDRRALEKARARKPNFAFGMLGIGAGEVLHSVFSDDVTCIVVDEKKVNFGGEIMSLSKAAVLVAQSTGRNWSSVAGPAYWKYKDRTLSELRDEAEADDD